MLLEKIFYKQNDLLTTGSLLNIYKSYIFIYLFIYLIYIRLFYNLINIIDKDLMDLLFNS